MKLIAPAIQRSLRLAITSSTSRLMLSPISEKNLRVRYGRPHLREPVSM
jgi:hypothetical protein